MAIQFDTVVNPETLTVELALIIIAFLIAYIWATFRLRSLITGFIYILTVVSLLLKIIVDLSLVWFWVGLLLTTVFLGISLGVFTLFDSRI